MAAPPIVERHLPHFHRRAPFLEKCRAATTANITISTALNNGDTLDGVTLATGDRVLVKDQSTGSQNGIYVVGVTPVRDYDLSTDDPNYGFLIFVTSGTANAGTLWENTNAAIPTIDSTALTFSEVTSGGSSGSVPWSYAQADGGLAGDGSTDDTAAFQAWITSVTASGTRSGWFFFEPGIYLIAGALQDTGARNAQILLPNVDITTGKQITLKFQGAARPPLDWFGVAQDPSGYAIIKSTLTGGTGTASMISGGNYGTRNNISVFVEDFITIHPNDPTFTVWNLDSCQGGGVKNLLGLPASVFAGTSFVEPTHSNSYYIKLPHFGLSNYTYVDGIIAGGIYTGLRHTDLAVTKGIGFGYCKVGVEIPEHQHASVIVEFHCSATQVPIKATGTAYCDILMASIEHNVIADVPSWAITTYDIDDASNYLHGTIRWFGWRLDTALPDHTFTVNGATNVIYREIGTREIWAPVMDGSGNVVTDGATGAAIMALT